MGGYSERIDKILIFSKIIFKNDIATYKLNWFWIHLCLLVMLVLHPRYLVGFIGFEKDKIHCYLQ